MHLNALNVYNSILYFIGNIKIYIREHCFLSWRLIINLHLGFKSFLFSSFIGTSHYIQTSLSFCSSCSQNFEWRRKLFAMLCVQTTFFLASTKISELILSFEREVMYGHFYKVSLNFLSEKLFNFVYISQNSRSITISLASLNC